MQNLKVTLIQTPLHWEDKYANMQMFDEYFDSIKEKTDLILLPEMFSTGFSMDSKTLAESVHGLSVAWMKQKAKEKNAVVCGSLIINEDGKYFNRLVWMRPDGNYSIYDKYKNFLRRVE